MDEIQHIAMIELYYFVKLMKHYLDPHWEERFWKLIHENCPELIRAIDASFRSAHGWGKITFTWDHPEPRWKPWMSMSDHRMKRETIKRLNGDAARLLLVLLTCDGVETPEDLPMLIELAGLTHTQNTPGAENRYARAFQQLQDLGFIEFQGRSISVLFEELLAVQSKLGLYVDLQSVPCELCHTEPALFEIDFMNEQGQADGVLACSPCTDHFKERRPCALVIPIAFVQKSLMDKRSRSMLEQEASANG